MDAREGRGGETSGRYIDYTTQRTALHYRIATDYVSGSRRWARSSRYCTLSAPLTSLAALLRLRPPLDVPPPWTLPRSPHSALLPTPLFVAAQPEQLVGDR